MAALTIILIYSVPYEAEAKLWKIVYSPYSIL